jgi:hypothetical protein
MKYVIKVVGTEKTSSFATYSFNFVLGIQHVYIYDNLWWTIDLFYVYFIHIFMYTIFSYIYINVYRFDNSVSLRRVLPSTYEEAVILVILALKNNIVFCSMSIGRICLS